MSTLKELRAPALQKAMLEVQEKIKNCQATIKAQKSNKNKDQKGAIVTAMKRDISHYEQKIAEIKREMEAK